MKIDASDSAVEAARQLIGLSVKEPLTLEMVLEHGAIGHPLDVEYVSDLLKGPLTLANVREWMSRMIDEHAVLVSQTVSLKASGSLTDDDIVEHILAHCPYEVRERMAEAKEAHPQLTYMRIIASVLIAKRDELHSGDTTLLTPLEKVQPVHGGLRRDVGFGPSTCMLERCSLPFIPRRTGQKYGCEACGNYAHRLVLWTTRREDAIRGEQPFITPYPEFNQSQDGICQCGQGSQTQAM